MNHNPQPSPATQPEVPSAAVATVMGVLASVRFAVAVVVVVAVACILGTVVPQGMEAAAYLQKHPGAAGWMEVTGKLGLTDVFHSGWFISLLCVFASTLAACTVRRFATLRRTTGFARRRAFGSMLAHISLLLILAGGVIRGVWGEKGFVELQKGRTLAQFQVGNELKPLPFGLHLDEFKIETDAAMTPASAEPVQVSSDGLDVEWLAQKVTARLPLALDTEHVLTPGGEKSTPDNSFRLKILKYVPDFSIDTATHEVVSRSSEPNNPAVLVQVDGPAYKNHRWVFARFPDFMMRVGDSDTGPSPLRMIFRSQSLTKHAAAVSGPIKNFRSTVSFVEADKVVQTRTVQVNQPLSYKGYTLYQSGYNPEDLSWSTLEVVRDPGVAVVYAGFALLMVGLLIIFYLNPWLSQLSAEPRRSNS